MRKSEQIRQLIGDLNYQINAPEITTMGECSMKCGNSSRGGRVCPACLIIKIGAIVGDGLAMEYAESLSKTITLRNRITEKAKP